MELGWIINSSEVLRAFPFEYDTMFTLYLIGFHAGVVVNNDSPKIMTPPVIILWKITTPRK